MYPPLIVLHQNLDKCSVGQLQDFFGCQTLTTPLCLFHTSHDYFLQFSPALLFRLLWSVCVCVHAPKCLFIIMLGLRIKKNCVQLILYEHYGVYNYNYIIIAEHSAAAFECTAWVQPDWEVIQCSTIQTEVCMSSMVLTLVFVYCKVLWFLSFGLENKSH